MVGARLHRGPAQECRGHPEGDRAPEQLAGARDHRVFLLVPLLQVPASNKQPGSLATLLFSSAYEQHAKNIYEKFWQKKKEQNEERFLYCSTQQQDLLEGKRRTRGPCGHLAALCTSQFCRPWSPGPTKLPTRVLRMRQRNLVKLRNCFKGSMTNGTQSTFGNESWSGSQA